MIKAVVYGADTPMAGELIRILVNHPEIESISAIAPGKPLMAISSMHHGLIGEENVGMTEKINPSGTDIIFLCDEVNDEIASLISKAGNKLRVVDLCRQFSPANGSGFVFGLPEIYRKEMVRGASKACVPLPHESLTLISLFPLASLLLLNSDINVTFHGNDLISVGEDTLQESAKDVASRLNEIQKSFSGAVNFKLGELKKCRGMKAEIELGCSLTEEDIITAFEQRYDDHNFTFVTRRNLDYNEVEGTSKCIVTVSKPDSSSLRLTSLADGIMRGGAGEAVHIMNLLFGLHEKTGLALKASSF